LPVLRIFLHEGDGKAKANRLGILAIAKIRPNRINACIEIAQYVT
jgi:hypothetical protein